MSLASLIQAGSDMARWHGENARALIGLDQWFSKCYQRALGASTTLVVVLPDQNYFHNNTGMVVSFYSAHLTRMQKSFINAIGCVKMSSFCSPVKYVLVCNLVF